MANYKGFLQDSQGNHMLPITRAELVLDQAGNIALSSALFEAGKKGDYGLISAADLAALKTVTGGTTGGQNLTDIYNKLSAINVGLTVGNVALPFYTLTDNVVTPNNITIQGINGVAVSTSGNNIQVGLDTVTQTSVLTQGQIVTGVTVDDYGRVTGVSGTSTLDNSLLPSTISGKELSQCTVTTSGTADNSLVNKKYIDDAVARAEGVASGALLFSGSVSQTENAENLLSEGDQRFYKANAAFTLDGKYVHGGTEGVSVQIKSGDTLITYKTVSDTTPKYIHIPSGNEITGVYVGTTENHNKIEQHVGDIKVVFDATLFDVTGSNGLAEVAMKQATAEQSGFLSSIDYKKFNSKTTTSYSDAGVGTIVLGTITIDGTEYEIKGVNNVSNLSLVNGTSTETPAVNPRLEFDEAGTKSYITIKGGAGIRVEKKENDVEISSTLNIADGSEPYLTLDTAGTNLGVSIATKDEVFANPNTVTNKLVNTAVLRDALGSYATTFLTLDASNSDFSITNMDKNKPYYYGSTALSNAVQF